MTTTSIFEMESMIRGYHVYQAVWHPHIGEELCCATEHANVRDRYAVAVRKSSLTIGHIPRKISTLCSLFLQRGGTITCQVTSLRRYSSDLVQGGLEIPCVLKFEGDIKLVNKVIKLAKIHNKSDCTAVDSNAEELPTIKEESDDTDEELPVNKKVCTVNGVNIADLTEIISEGGQLTDLHMEYAQKLLKKQFPHINGLQPTVCLTRTTCNDGPKKTLSSNQLQIVHTRGNHWIVVSAIDCEEGVVNVYDSLYETIVGATREIILNIFQASLINMVESQKQEGVVDCGLFAIANATSLAYGTNPGSYVQSLMRQHLVNCLESGVLPMFPSE
ncbi:uncharacterized protein LOC135336575 [Halichondria panicea]|uniref:uncharacterized protein LOC135336575 n=1 Tax=Halichondria panicea TaxID=6063 RepID=UPI00312B2FA7